MCTKKSFWEPIAYENGNVAQQNTADELIKEIQKDGVSISPIIVDIGCGSGNITEKLSKIILHDKIYAFDCDSNMVSYANEHHNDGTIEYFTQDAGVPWEQLDEKLKALEGKVDMVWSNAVFQWIKDKETAAQTVFRLLAPGGRFYAQILLFREPFQFAENNLKNINVFGTQNEQIETIVSAFKNYEFSVVNGRMTENEHTFESYEQYWQLFDGYWSAVDKDLLMPAANTYFGGDLAKTIKAMRDNNQINYGIKFGGNHHEELPSKYRMCFEMLLLCAQKQR